MPRKDENSQDSDGLIAPLVGPWSAEKYGLTSYYAKIFSGGMKNLWHHLAYIDLYAGSGRAKIRETGECVDTSALLALKTEPPFGTYIFCDLNAGKLSALKQRAALRYPNANAVYIQGDARSSFRDILQALPKHRADYKVLTFCMIDPFNTSNFSFEIIEQLGKRPMDFMVLIPSGMDIGRNIAYYADEGNVSLDHFLGDPNWREKWTAFQQQGRRNADFGVEQFCDRMIQLGYQDSRQYLKPVKVTGTEKLLYHLAFFTKHPRGLDFWKKALKGTNPQTSFLEGL